MTITFSAIYIPIFITVVSLFYSIFIVKDEGMLGGLTNLMYLIPSLFISMISWIIYAIAK